MVFEKSWEQFRKDGMLLFINSILHYFGWAIVVELNEKQFVMRAYPARVKFRGFDEKSTSKAHIQVANYLKQNAAKLFKEAND